MANQLIRPSNLPSRANPVSNEVVPSDNGSTVAKVTWADGVAAGRPLANQGEAEAGANATKAMTPLTTKQSIDAQVPAKIAAELVNYTPTSGLATVATSGDYDDLSNKPYTVPAGGTTGQVLAKASAADGDTEWVTGGGGGGGPTISPGDEKKVIQVNADSDAYELVPSQNVSANSVSLLSLLTDAEATSVLAGTNSIDISAKIAAAITDLATNSPGFTLDMSMMHGADVTVTQDWFAGLAVAKGRIITGPVKLLVNFNTTNFRIPSGMTWEARGTKIEPSTTITGVANREGGIGYLVNTFVGGQGRTCSSTTLNTITVSDADGIEVGATIAVYGTQRDFNFQFTLNGAIDSSATSIAITGASTIDPAVAMFRLGGTEYVFGFFSGGTLDTTYTGGGRGKLGSTATSHSNGAAVLLMQSMVRTVTAISGNVLTLDADIDINFTDAEFRFGTVGSALVGDIEIDGKDNKAVPGYLTAAWNCLGGLLSAGFTTKGDIRLKGGLTGGYMLMGARRANLEIESIDLCGHPADSLGASGWLFGSCRDISVHVKRTSNGNISNAVDNKSSGIFSMGLWQPNYRFHVVHDVVLSHNIAHDVTASSDGYCGSSYADCSDALAGIFDGTPQQPAGITAAGVTIEIKGYKTFFAPTGNSLAGTGNSVRLGTYFSGANAILTADGAGADSRVVFRSAGAAKWQMISALASGSFTLYNGAFNAGVLLANQSATSWSAVSDRRVKDDVKTLSVLDRLDRFNAVSYTNKLTGVREIGVIAQDEIERAPEFVNRGSGSDDDEITSMSDNRFWSVSYDRYGVEALQGVKELLAVVRQQQAEIDSLKESKQ